MGYEFTLRAMYIDWRSSREGDFLKRLHPRFQYTSLRSHEPVNISAQQGSFTILSQASFYEHVFCCFVSPQLGDLFRLSNIVGNVPHLDGWP